MAVLYITEQGSELSISRGRAVVEKSGTTLLSAPLGAVEAVVIAGNVSVTTPALSEFLRRGTDVTFLSSDFAFKGRLQGPDSRGVRLRIAQCERNKDPDFVLSLSKGFVKGKIGNQRRLLMRCDRNRPDQSFDRLESELEGCIEQAAFCSSLDELMGVEGHASKVYFDGLALALDKHTEFAKRTRRPPRDPFNAVLSLGYSLLLREITSAVCSVGLDPYMGYLHALRAGRPALALDLMEEFRPAVADRLALSLFNLGTLTPQSFVRQDAGFRLTKPALRAFLREWEEAVTTPFKMRSGRPTDMRRVFIRQASKLASSVRRGVADYRAFTLR
jgi:CRISPR-associated protein Cas1